MCLLERYILYLRMYVGTVLCIRTTLIRTEFPYLKITYIFAFHLHSSSKYTDLAETFEARQIHTYTFQ